MGEEARGLIKDCDDGFKLLPQPRNCVDDEAATSLSKTPTDTQLVCNTPQVCLNATSPYTDSAWDLIQVENPFEAEISASELERYLDFTTPLSDCDDGFELLPQPSICVDDEAAISLSPLPTDTQLVFNTPQCDDGFKLLSQPSNCVDDEATTSLSPTPLDTQLVCNTPQVGLDATPPYNDSAWDLLQFEFPFDDAICPRDKGNRIVVNTSFLEVEYPFDAEICASELERFFDFTTPLSDASPSYIQNAPCPTQEGPLTTHTVPISTLTDSLSNQPGPSLTIVCPPISQTCPTLNQSAFFTIHTDSCETQALPNFQRLDVLETQTGPSHIHEGSSHTQARPSHSKNIVRLKTMTVKCKCCNSTFTRKSCLERHMRTVHPEEPTFFVCRHCGARSSREDSLLLHIKNKHSHKPGHHQCPNCGREYIWKNNLRRHMKHECGVPHQFTCSQCSFMTHYKSDLKRHMFNIHGSV